MAHTIQRLTMYALISALESDLRDFASVNILPFFHSDVLFSDQVLRKCTERFSKDFPEGQPSNEDLLLYLDLGELIDILRGKQKTLDDTMRSYFSRFYNSMEAIIPIRNRVMHSRPLDFEDLPRVASLAAELERSHRTIWANIRTTIRLLEKNPDFVTGLTIPLEADQKTILNNLPLVEFDDTGFMGRDKELRELNDALFGSFPVVTIVGEGGLGKTALAMKACYDLLDSDNPGFDAIVWTTAKTTKLTANEIELIDNAVYSSLGIVESASAVLGRQMGTSALDDLLLHLESAKVLLIIDNLETVVDQTMRDLVRRTPSGSKILFTTRIGLGAFDFPIPLRPLNKRESAQYFRRAARAWGVEDMARADQDVVDSYCNHLQHNPLSIKCFMQSVKIGYRPSQIASDQKVFLQFCLQNVFNSLSVESKIVARTLAGVSGPQSLPSLAFYTEMDSLSVQSALTHLITSNLVSSEKGRGSEDEDRFLLSPLARAYIHKFLKPEIDEQKRLLSKQNTLRSAQEEYESRIGTDMFDINFVFIRDKDDYIVARILTRAIELVFKKDFERAETEVEKARDLSPNYFEVHRVKAFVLMNQNDFFGASDAFEAALSFAPNSAPLRLWYGGFLSRSMGDSDRALEQILKAESLAPNSTAIKLECARLMQYKRRFDEAKQRLSSVLDLEKLSAKTRRVHLDLQLQGCLRESEHRCKTEDWEGGLAALEDAKDHLDKASTGVIDHRTLKTLERAKRNLQALRRAFKGLEHYKRLELFSDWLDRRILMQPNETLEMRSDGVDHSSTFSEVDVESLPPRGRLANLRDAHGFIMAGEIRIFFYKGTWKSRTAYIPELEGQIVNFKAEHGPKGLRATEVALVEELLTERREGESLAGKIKSLQTTFGFISMDGGGDIFFHRTNCKEDSLFQHLSKGQRLKFIYRIKQDHKIYGDEVELET